MELRDQKAMVNWKKRMLVIVLALMLLISLLIIININGMLRFGYGDNEATPAPGNIPDNRIKSFFDVNGNLYFLAYDGTLYLHAEDDRLAVYSFPTHYVYWSDCLARFLFCSEGKLWAFDPLTEQIEELILISTFEGLNPGYLIGASSDYALVWTNGVTMLVNLRTLEKSEVAVSSKHLLCEEGGLFFFRGPDYNSTTLFDCETQKTRNIQLGDFVHSICTADVIEHKLFFVCSDRKLRVMDLHSEETTCSSMSGNQVISFFYTDKSFFMLSHKGDVPDTLVVSALSQDGECIASTEVDIEGLSCDPDQTEFVVDKNKYVIYLRNYDRFLCGTL